MRVAVYHNLPPGGALRVVREFQRRIGADVEYDLFALDFGAADPFSYADQDEGEDSHARETSQAVDTGGWSRLAGGRLARLAWLRAIREAERRVAHQINRGGYDVAMVHPCWFSQTPSILRDLQVPTVYFMQEVRRLTFEPGYRPRPFPKRIRAVPGWLVETAVEQVLRRRDRRAAAAADVLLCNSQYMADTIQRCYGRAATVSYLGVDHELFDVSETTARTDLVLSVGGLEEFKGHHLVVEALGLLPPRDRPALGLVYQRCDRAYRQRLLTLAQERQVVLVEHVGIDDRALAELYASSRATVLAAQLEPFGLVALESLACGTPVVAFREGGYLETVEDGVNGLLVERSVPALSAGISRILAGDLTTTASQLRGSVIPEWTWEAAVRRQLSALQQCVQSRP